MELKKYWGDKMSKYQNDATELLELLGGRENIVSMTHCITRLRLVLRDENIPDISKIEKLKTVKGSFRNAGQFQIIIGNGVKEFFEEITQISGLDNSKSREEIKENISSKRKVKFYEKIIGDLAEIFVPIIPAIIAGGLILGLRNIFEGIQFIDGKTLVQVYPVVAELNSILWVPAQAIFHFLPVAVCWSTVRKYKGSEVLGVIMGIMLVSPQLLNAYRYAAENAAGTVPAWNFGVFTIQKVGYQAQVLPAMFAGMFMAKMENFMKKHVHESIKLVVIPISIILVTMILSYTVIGPVAREIGNVVAAVFEWLLMGPYKLIGAVIFGLIYSPLVITGLHHTFVAVNLQLIATIGGTMLFPLVALNNISQGTAVLATYFIHKDENHRAMASSSAISAYLGVTEPAMYGVNLRFKYPFYASLIGTATACFTSIFLGVMANSIGIGGLPAILSIQPKYYVSYLIAMVVAVAVTFTLTMAFSKTKMNKAEKI